ncbi:hypothetical protein GCM10007350_28300 [Jeongeupia chitinilytica]|uniref:Large ribosomal RNA subunit accumulation protein YceD n=2 Tax=Jeongeupia chitinilytica TaxID=1041641 RepID=A0ABQ3H206_9NEIS|nr:hypothetical protein GCM10007350_28300 [Jeongeupia chitinilytica]
MGMTVIHSAEFAREGGVLDGVIPVAAMLRLSDQLASSGGEIRWSLSGSVDRFERPRLNLTVSGELQLVCQRCLAPMAWSLDVSTVLTQFPTEEQADEAAELDETLETVLIDPALDVPALIEEEVLLALPYAPLHEQCAAPGDEPLQSNTKPNPFAVLAQMKTRKAE